MTNLRFAAVLLVATPSCASRPCGEAAPPPLPSVRAAADGDAGVTVCDIETDAPECIAAAYARLPRCSPQDPRCGPQPVYRDQSCPSESAARIPFAPAARIDTHCSHDGECRITCFNACARYSVSSTCTIWQWHVYFAGEKEARSRDGLPDPTWCGCIAGECRYFTE
jgi:hypothetical protein